MASGYPYDKKKLAENCPKILGSVFAALEVLNRRTYFRIIPLDEGDPPELWRYALAHLRNHSTHQVYEAWRNELGMPTLAETTLALLQRTQSDSLFSQYLSKALAIYDRGMVSAADYKKAGVDTTDQLLIQHWIRFHWKFPSIGAAMNKKSTDRVAVKQIVLRSDTPGWDYCPSAHDCFRMLLSEDKTEKSP